MTAAVDQVLARWDAAQEPLTVSQREVLFGLVEGLTAIQIAERLEVSPDTVRARLRRLYAALGVTTGPAAVVAAVRLGLIEVPR